MEPDITNPDDLFKLLSVANQAGGLTPNKAKDIVYEAIGDVAEPFPEEWGEVPLALQKQQSTGNADVGGLMMQMRKQIAKAENNHDDEIVAVMKEVKNLLQSRQDSDIIKVDWNEEDHPRDDHGRFTSGVYSLSAARTDYGEKYGYYKERRADLNGNLYNRPTLKLPTQEYAKVQSEIATNHSLYEGHATAVHFTSDTDGYHMYYFENRGYGDYNIYHKEDDLE